MSRAGGLLVLVAALLAAAPAYAASVDRTEFRYARALRPSGDGPALVEPDGALYAHARPGFGDLRAVDARGRQVPWRFLSASSASVGRERRLVRRIRSLAISTSGRETVVTADLGHTRIPVDEVEISAATPRYDRPVEIKSSNDGRHWVYAASGRTFRFPGSAQSPIRVATRARYVRVTIRNGDDEALTGIRLSALARPRTILFEGGHPRPLTLLYGSPTARTPNYDFARLPGRAVGLERARTARLGGERANAAFRAPPDARSFAARHPGLLQAALALAAVALAATGLLALWKSSPGDATADPGRERGSG